MGLVLARDAGEAFWVGDLFFRVVAVEGTSVLIAGPQGRGFVVTAEETIDLAENVSVRETKDRVGSTAKLQFQADRSIPIYRAELVTSDRAPDVVTHEFALLAPVPLEHLLSSVEKLAEAEKVAFGSRAWEVFRDLDVSRRGAPVPVLFYASHDGASYPPMVSWTARYLRHVEGRGGAHPEGMTFRPSSTAKYRKDNSGHWAVFWEVDDLRKLAVEQQVRIDGLKSGTSGKPLASGYRPEGPIVVFNPFV